MLLFLLPIHRALSLDESAADVWAELGLVLAATIMLILRILYCL